MSTFSKKPRKSGKNPKLTHKEQNKILNRYNTKLQEFEKVFKSKDINALYELEGTKMSSTDREALKFVINSKLT